MAASEETCSLLLPLHQPLAEDQKRITLIGQLIVFDALDEQSEIV
jgi:hypothetical protein